MVNLYKYNKVSATFHHKVFNQRLLNITIIKHVSLEHMLTSIQIYMKYTMAKYKYFFEYFYEKCQYNKTPTLTSLLFEHLVKTSASIQPEVTFILNHKL